MRIGITEEDRDRILALYADGRTFSAIGRIMHRPPSTIRYVIKVAGGLDTTRLNKRRQSPDRKRRIYGFGIFILPRCTSRFRWESCIITNKE